MSYSTTEATGMRARAARYELEQIRSQLEQLAIDLHWPMTMRVVITQTIDARLAQIPSEAQEANR